MPTTAKLPIEVQWNRVTHRCLQEYHMDLTTGVTPANRRQIIQIIAEEFHHLPHVRIAAFVDRSIQNETFPSHIKKLLTYIQFTMR